MFHRKCSLFNHFLKVIVGPFFRVKVVRFSFPHDLATLIWTPHLPPLLWRHLKLLEMDDQDSKRTGKERGCFDCWRRSALGGGGAQSHLTFNFLWLDMLQNISLLQRERERDSFFLPERVGGRICKIISASKSSSSSSYHSGVFFFHSLYGKKKKPGAQRDGWGKMS